MSFDHAAAVARTVLYEGYMLWPYRRSALKNQRRWTFGSVLPRAWSERGHPDDAWRMRTECLLMGAPQGATVAVRVRFLQVMERRVSRVRGEELEPVDEMDVDGERWVSWDEAREREIDVSLPEIAPGAETEVPIRIAAGADHQWVERATGDRVAAVVRSWRELSGTVRVSCDAVADDAFRIGVEVINASDWNGRGREDALRSAFTSTHIVLEASGAEFTSLTDPPEELREAAAACTQEGCWPVLVGARGARDSVLAAPIILPDYPMVAPESPGDLFDGGEIDELLTLHVLALTDREKEEMRATDPRTREILERTTALAGRDLLGLHGTRRDGATGDPLEAHRTPGATEPAVGVATAGGARGVEEHHAGMADDAPDAFWREMGRPAHQRLVVDGTLLRRGSRVRLRPRDGGDVMDVVLAGRVAVVEGIDEDESGAPHLTVAVEGDPGIDLGMARMPGHRFYFRPEEVEPLDGPSGEESG